MAKKLYKERCFCKKIEDCICDLKRDEICSLSTLGRSIENVTDSEGRI